MLKWDRNAFIYWVEYAVAPKIMFVFMGAVLACLFLLFAAPALAFFLAILYYAKETVVVCFSIIGGILDAIASITNF